MEIQSATRVLIIISQRQLSHLRGGCTAAMHSLIANSYEVSCVASPLMSAWLRIVGPICVQVTGIDTNTHCSLAQVSELKKAWQRQEGSAFFCIAT